MGCFGGTQALMKGDYVRVKIEGCYMKGARQTKPCPSLKSRPNYQDICLLWVYKGQVWSDSLN